MSYISSSFPLYGAPYSEIEISYNIRRIVLDLSVIHSALKLEKMQFQKYKNTLFAFSNMTKNQFLH